MEHSFLALRRILLVELQCQAILAWLRDQDLPQGWAFSFESEHATVRSWSHWHVQILFIPIKRESSFLHVSHAPFRVLHLSRARSAET